MDLPSESILLRIFIGENDRFEGKPLYEAIVLKAREAQLAGATVLRGPMGFGRSTRIHRSNFLDISEDLPFIIEIVDEAAKIEAFRPQLRDMLGSALVTMEKVTVLRYGDEKGGDEKGKADRA